MGDDSPEMDEDGNELGFPDTMMDEEPTKRDSKISETLVEIEDFLHRVVWIIQHPTSGYSPTDVNVEDQRCRIAMQLAEMRGCGEASILPQ